MNKGTSIGNYYGGMYMYRHRGTQQFFSSSTSKSLNNYIIHLWKEKTLYPPLVNQNEFSSGIIIISNICGTICSLQSPLANTISFSTVTFEVVWACVVIPIFMEGIIKVQGDGPRSYS